MTKDEALHQLADCDGRDILAAAAAVDIAAAFGLRPTVYPLTDEYFDDATLDGTDRRADEAGIMVLDLLEQVAQHEGVSTESSHFGRRTRFHELLDRVQAHLSSPQ